VALPVTDWLLADGFAGRLRVGALGVAQRIFADGVALRALADFAVLHRAAYFTFWLIALDFTLGATEFLAARGALWRLADGLADLVAHGLVRFHPRQGMLRPGR
jgi:hypothetical protein